MYRVSPSTTLDSLEEDLEQYKYYLVSDGKTSAHLLGAHTAALKNQGFFVDNLDMTSHLPIQVHHYYIYILATIVNIVCIT